MFRLDTESDRDRFASLLVSLSMTARLAEDAVLIARMRDQSAEPKPDALKIVSQGRDALANLLGWVAGDNPQALNIAQMRLMELTAEKITIGHARAIVDELHDMRDVVSDLGQLVEPCPVCDDKTYIYEGNPQIAVDCPACAQKEKEQTVIKDEDMRTQAFNTMKALEAFVSMLAALPFAALPDEIREMFNKHTNTSGVPGPTSPPLINGERLCLNCGFKAFYERGRRLWNDARDTCTCSPETVRVEPPPGPYIAERCSLCNKLQHRISGDLVQGATGECRCKRKDSNRQPSTEPTAKTADQLARAIALLTMKMFEKKEPFDNKISDYQIYRLLGLRPCEECRGTGWLARDETCKTCKRAGWLSA